VRLTPPIAPSFGARPHFGVPGGMCGMPYDHRIHLPPGLRLKAVYLDARCGVRAMADEPARLVGTPLVDGTHVVRLECSDASGATVMGEAQLVISRDPRSLWRNLPSNRAAPHWKPDQVSQRAECRGWRALALSRRGRSHANVGKCREDDVAVRVVSEQMLAVAMADGAGSAALSRLGSHLAVEAAIQTLDAGILVLTPEALQTRLAQAALAANAALHGAAVRYGVGLNELATTLLLSVLVPGPQALLACLQIGDGAIAACDGSRIYPLSNPDRGDYASQTTFVSDARVEPRELAARIHVQALAATRWVLLATDGVTDPYLETEQSLHDAQCWAPLAAQLERAAAAETELAEQSLTQWLDAFTPGHHDDRTLVLLHPVASGGADR
jgi:serine/threonine protein phosphatase PrpC